QFVLAVDDYDIAGIYSCAQSDAVGGGLCDRNALYLGCVVFAPHIYVGALRPALDGGGGHDDQVLFDVGQQMNVDKLVREQKITVVVEDGFQFIGAGRGVDLIVDSEQLS